MARNIDDADDDYGHRPARPSRSPVLIVLAVGGLVLVVAAVVCGGFALVGTRAVREAAQQQAAVERAEAAKGVIQPAGGKVGDSKKVYTREEFKKLVMGKTPEEVIAAVGRPGSTDDELHWWVYHGRVLNPATGKPDSAILVFEDGRVTEIR